MDTSNIEDLSKLLGKYKLQIGENVKSKEAFNYLWSKGSRLIDLGSYDNSNNDLYLEHKEDCIFCKQFSLNDEYVYNETGYHIYDTDDNILSSAIDKIFQKQLKLYDLKFFHMYIVTDIFKENYYRLHEENLILYNRIFNILKEYKQKGLIKHLGFMSDISYQNLKIFMNQVFKNFVNDIDFTFVPFNFLSYNSENRSIYNIDIKDTPGEMGLSLLKTFKLTNISINPFEGGLLNKVIPIYEKEHPYINLKALNYKSILDCNNIDYILLGSSNLKHLKEIDYIYNAKIQAGNVIKFLSSDKCL